MTTTALVINHVGTTDHGHDHGVVSGRVSDRVEHPSALALVTGRGGARWGGDSVRHLARPFPSTHTSVLILLASCDDPFSSDY
jgi:hypothetical protein